MNKLLSSASQAAIFAAAFLFAAGGFVPDASAQRYLCSKLGNTCKDPGGTTEIENPDPLAGNKKFYFSEDLKDSTSLVTTTKNESIKTMAPTINGFSAGDGKKKWKSGKLKTTPGTVVFSGDENQRGCAWIPKSGGDPAAFPLINATTGYKTTVRGYYTLKFDKDDDNERGEGTVLAFLPGSTEITNSLCGNYGSSLGYADGGSYTSMPEPRFGIEVDISRNTSLADPDNNHIAIVYNGVHHNGTLAPACPATSTANDTTTPYGGCWVGAKESHSGHDDDRGRDSDRGRDGDRDRGRRAWSDGIVLASASFDDLPLPAAKEEDGSFQLADRDEDKDKDKEKEKEKDEDKGKGKGKDEDKDKEDREKDHEKDKKDGVKANWLEDGREHGIRVEITNGHASCPVTQLHVKAWACKSGDRNCGSNPNYKAIAASYTGTATGVVEACVPFDPATYANLVIGFTYGSSNQKTRVTYGNFVIQTFDIK